MQTSRATWIVCHTAPWLLKELWLLIDHFDSQAFTPALPHQHSFEFAALYTLQHRLARNAEFERGLQHRQIVRQLLLHDACPQLIGDPNLPRRAWSYLLAGDETICQPAMNRRSVHAENLRCLPNRNQLPGGRFSRRLESRDIAIAAQTADLVSGEAFTGSCLSSLPIQDSGDHFIGIEHGQAP